MSATGTLPPLPEPYCLLCEKVGHLTTECHSTHGLNTSRAHEIARLSACATALDRGHEQPDDLPRPPGYADADAWLDKTAAFLQAHVSNCLRGWVRMAFKGARATAESAEPVAYRWRFLMEPIGWAAVWHLTEQPNAPDPAREVQSLYLRPDPEVAKLRAEVEALRKALSGMLTYFDRPKRDEWLNDAAWKEAVDACAAAHAALADGQKAEGG